MLIFNILDLFHNFDGTKLKSIYNKNRYIG